MNKTYQLDFGINDQLNSNLDSLLFQNKQSLKYNSFENQNNLTEGHDDRDLFKPVTVTNKMSLHKMHDNINSESRSQINGYIREMDKRLSVPKFKIVDDLNSPERSRKNLSPGLGLESQKKSLLTVAEN